MASHRPPGLADAGAKKKDILLARKEREQKEKQAHKLAIARLVKISRMSTQFNDLFYQAGSYYTNMLFGYYDSTLCNGCGDNVILHGLKMHAAVDFILPFLDKYVNQGNAFRTYQIGLVRESPFDSCLLIVSLSSHNERQERMFNAKRAFPKLLRFCRNFLRLFVGFGNAIVPIVKLNKDGTYDDTEAMNMVTSPGFYTQRPIVFLREYNNVGASPFS
jgi:hypothetical protein